MHFLAYFYVVFAFRGSPSRAASAESLSVGQSVTAGDEAFEAVLRQKSKSSNSESSSGIGTLSDDRKIMSTEHVTQGEIMPEISNEHGRITSGLDKPKKIDEKTKNQKVDQDGEG